MPLSPPKQAFLDGLRIGDLDAAGLTINEQISGESLEYFNNYKDLLETNGHSFISPADLYLVIKRKSLLRLLKYADERNILGLQYCYGLNRALRNNGRLQLINIGTMPDNSLPDDRKGRKDEEIFYSNFKLRNVSGDWVENHFLNFDLKNRLMLNEVKDFSNKFSDLYSGFPKSNPAFRKGSVLPVKSLIEIFDDLKGIFGSFENITFRWGIDEYEPKKKLGNFTLAIGIGDLSEGPAIERKNNKIIDPPGEGDCPPRPPCNG